MIYFGLDLIWPLTKPKNQKDIFYKEFKVSKNKTFEIQLSQHGGSGIKLLGIDFSYWPYQDHAGPKLEISFLSFWLILFLYDNRHWDNETGTWDNFTYPFKKDHWSDPVQLQKDGWYFWDETWGNKYGPYISEEEARTKLNSYCEEHLGT